MKRRRKGGQDMTKEELVQDAQQQNKQLLFSNKYFINIYTFKNNAKPRKLLGGI